MVRPVSKQKINPFLVGTLAFLFLVLGLTGLSYFPPVPPLAKGDLAITGPGGQRHEFKVEVADTPQRMANGLMYRDHLAADAGMLFIYDSVRETAMWMKNTRIPLDMLFMDEKGVVVHIHENARPFDETPISSRLPVKATLELNGGTVAQLGIRTGFRVVFPVFSGASN